MLLSIGGTVLGLSGVVVVGTLAADVASSSREQERKRRDEAT